MAEADRPDQPLKQGDEGSRSSEEAETLVGHIDTRGGAYVQGDVQARGDFIGRDQITIAAEQAYRVSGLPNPYLGLRSYTYQDRAAYAGREAGVATAVERLTRPGMQPGLVFITGASGSGKSSIPPAQV